MNTLPRVSLYAAMLAAAGLPLYIHLPRFASVELGISLGALGSLLLVLRLVDLLQDPAIGWMVDRWPALQRQFAALAALGLMVGFPLLFALEAGPWVLWQMAAVLVLLFSAYSLGMILLYGRSTTLASDASEPALLQLASYREAGMLIGVILAAITPAVLGGYQSFGLCLGALALITLVLSAPIWRRSPQLGEHLSFARLVDAGALRLLLIALINSLPVAVTSTLFLFFVEDRLQLKGQAGPLLVLFFLAAALSVPLWSRLAARHSPRTALLIAMPLAILSFIWAAFLGPGDQLGFAVICLTSGAALGADMVLLPAMFSLSLTRAGISAGTAFGFWSFVGKLALALAAFLVLPLLEQGGFTPGADNDAAALLRLTLLYAGLPCILKLGAFALVLALPKPEPTS